MRKIKVAIVDDQFLFREGLISLMEEFDELQIVLQAANGREFINALESGVQVDIVLLDVEMPVMDGIETAKVLHKKYPNIKILAITMHDDQSFIDHFYSHGARGYLLKDASVEKVFEAITFVMNNKGFFSRERIIKESGENISSKYSPAAPLTEREIEIIGLLCRQYQNKEIAEMLSISIRTVDAHREHIMEKLGVKGVAGIVAFGIKNDLHLTPLKSNGRKKDSF